MNIQIFGKAKCFDTKKAERFFKERGVKYQFIDVVKYGMSKGEYNSVKNAVGGMRQLIDEKSKAYEDNYCAYLADEAAVEEKLLEHPAMFRTPIVRNGKKATIIANLQLDDDTLKKLAAELKRSCSVGGSARGGEILIQGDMRDKVLKFLTNQGFKARII